MTWTNAAPYTRAQCQNSAGGHVVVGAGTNGPCYRCGLQGAGAGGAGNDTFTNVARPEDVPDPLGLMPERPR